MASLLFLSLAILAMTGFVAKRCLATTYTVGDTSGWDISTDVDSWAKDKHFVVGDVLVFQYSSSHSVAEVNQDSYKGCNTTNLLQPSSNGNTTFALTKPGDRYFVCGNRLHCYAGMKLHVAVDGNATEGLVPAGAPQPAEAGGDSTSIPPTAATATNTNTNTNTPSSKKKNPPSIVPNSVMHVSIGLKPFVFVGFTSVMVWVF